MGGGNKGVLQTKTIWIQRDFSLQQGKIFLRYESILYTLENLLKWSGKNLRYNLVCKNPRSPPGGKNPRTQLRKLGNFLSYSSQSGRTFGTGKNRLLCSVLGAPPLPCPWLRRWGRTATCSSTSTQLSWPTWPAWAPPHKQAHAQRVRF